MLVFVNNYLFGFSKQTIFYYDENYFLTKFATRELHYLTGTMQGPWVEHEIATKDYVEEKLGIVDEELSTILGV